MSSTLRLAVCLFPNVTTLDYQGAVELFSVTGFAKTYTGCPEPAYIFDIEFLSHTLDPVTPTAGVPRVLPGRTYAEAIAAGLQYDIVLIPGGPTPDKVPGDLLDFVKKQAPGLKYILTVCTGSWILANTGLLDGRRATTNKALFRDCQAATSKSIEWVEKARWVVDGNIWTSSGVTAGADMAYAFLVHLVGVDIAKVVAAIVELDSREQGDDPFADYWLKK